MIYLNNLNIRIKVNEIDSDIFHLCKNRYCFVSTGNNCQRRRVY